METKIKSILRQIESDQNVRILFACESGSRGWEFPSADSDYDVRFIYLRPIDFYLSVKERDYELRFPISNDLDIAGWDLRKTLQLAGKSNTTPLEWLQSPIVYLQEDHFTDRLWKLCQRYFNQRSNVHHYLGIARSMMWKEDATPEITIKKLFYILRSLLAANWCLNFGEIAPMSIVPLMSTMPGELRASVDDLIALKSSVGEGFNIQVTPEILKFINDSFALSEARSKELKHDYFEFHELDDFFHKSIKYYDNKANKGLGTAFA